MRNELLIKDDAAEHKVFFQEGFYTPYLLPTPIHKHNYAEIHLVTDDAAEFYIDGKTYYSKVGNLLLIPKNTPHYIIKGSDGPCHVAFQIDYNIKNFMSCHVTPQLARDFIDKIINSKDYGIIAAYVRLLCSFLEIEEKPPVQPIADYGFLICEYFSKHYTEDLSLASLAKELHLSTRQTERLVIKYTGQTFRQRLTAIRMEMAKHLSTHSNMSLGQIAQAVGYRSYAGFWKALNSQK